MAILLTGGSGHVGANLLRELLARGEKVKALVRAGTNREPFANLDVELVEGELSSPASLEQALRGCDRVYHCAARVQTVRGREQAPGGGQGGGVGLEMAAQNRRLDDLEDQEGRDPDQGGITSDDRAERQGTDSNETTSDPDIASPQDQGGHKGFVFAAARLGHPLSHPNRRL